MKIAKDRLTDPIWFEKYKPTTIEDLIIPDVIKQSLLKSVSSGVVPNYGFFSASGGTGKSSTVNAILSELNGEAIWINASLENGIDTIRGKVQAFASQQSFDDKRKIIVLDECLEENEKVIFGTLDNNYLLPLNTLIKGEIYNTISFNMNTGNFENDTCEVVSDKVDEIFEIEFEDGTTIKVTGNHPFIVENDGIFIEKTIFDGLSKEDNIVVFNKN